MSSEEGSPEGDSGEPSVPTETLDFLFEYTRKAPQRQLEAVDALDNKASALFSASAVVVGLAGIGIWNKQEFPPGAGVLLSVAVAAFLVVGAMVLYSSWLRRHRLSFQADELWERYWDEPISEIKSALVAVQCVRPPARPTFPVRCGGLQSLWSPEETTRGVTS